MRSGFFNDTEVWAEDFARFAAGILTNGVLADSESALKVTAGGGMKVNIAPGYCWINGHFGLAEYSETLTLNTADGSLARIDRIVARLDLSNNSVHLHNITGTPAASPVAPSVVRNGTYYDLGLATVSIPAGTLTITNAMITDTRRDVTVCGGVYPSRSDAFIWPSANNVGDIKLTAASSAPPKWLLCRGQAIRRNTYAELFSVIGTTYGSGDGQTTFNIPDLRERFPYGSTGALGTKGGAAEHTLTIAEMPAHNHDTTGKLTKGQSIVEPSSQSEYDAGRATKVIGNFSISAESDTGSPISLANATVGEGETFSIMPPFITLNYIIYTGV